jgi:hypothetical protein
VVGVGLEHGPRTLTLRADDATHLLRRGRRRGGGGGGGRGMREGALCGKGWRTETKEHYIVCGGLGSDLP